MCPSGMIRPIRFRRDIPRVADMIEHNFQASLSEEGVDFDEYSRIARRTGIASIFDVLHPFLRRFVEVFVWIQGEEMTGTGTVERIHLGDKTRWLLCNFAISPKRRVSFATVVGMRSLMRVAIEHALLSGALEISAFIRENNRAAYALCRSEGFEDAGEYSYHMLSRAKIDAIQPLADRYPQLTLRRARSAMLEALVRLISRGSLGYQKWVFVAYSGHDSVAQVEMGSGPGYLSAYRAEIRPTTNLTQSLGGTLITAIAGIAANIQRNVLVSFPTDCVALNKIMERQNIPLLARRRRLVFRPEMRTCPRLITGV